jgi:hypothetical protein
LNTLTVLREDPSRSFAGLKLALPLVSMLVAFIVVGISVPAVLPVSAASGVESSVSVFVNCPTSVSFAEPSASGACGSGNYTGTWSGVAQTVGSAQDSVFYLSAATGGVKVNYSLIDSTTGKFLVRWAGFGSISGGTCSAPSVVTPATQATNSAWYAIGTGNVISPGDKLSATFSIVFTGTGTPTICSGAGSASVISLDTTVSASQVKPALTTTLQAGVAVQGMLGGYDGVSETYLNTGSTSVTALVLGVLKDSSGRTVDMLSTSITANPGATVTAFLPFKQYPSGSYTMTLIAITTLDAPISTVATASVTV